MTESEERTGHRVAFVCVQNTGRRQMVAAFAERERDRRGVRLVGLRNEESEEYHLYR